MEQCPLGGDVLIVCDRVGTQLCRSHCSPKLMERLRDVMICKSRIKLFNDTSYPKQIIQN